MKKNKKYAILSFCLLLLVTFTSCKKKTACEKNGHQFNDATCTNPKICKVCGATEGAPLGHTFEDATYFKPRTCKVCGTTEGSPLSPDVVDVTDKTLTVVVGDLFTINVNFPDNADFNVEISDEKIVTLESKVGNICSINAVAVGSTKITFRTIDGSKISVTDVTVANESPVEYQIKYQDKVIDNKKVVLPEDAITTYKASKNAIKLPEISVDKYAFLGWATADIVKEYGKMPLDQWYQSDLLWHEIPAGTTGDLELTPMFGYSRFEADVENNIIDLNGTVTISVVKKYFTEAELAAKVTFTSNDDQILTVNENGEITPVSAGYTTVKIGLEGFNDLNLSIGITVVEDLSGLDELLALLVSVNRDKVISQNITVTGYQFVYAHRLLGSVSDYLFAPHEVDESILTPEGNSNRPGDVHQKYYITVHDTASSANTADAKQHANYVKNGGDGTSWHYSSGDTGIYHQIPDNERAYHAGDGSREYHLNESDLSAKEGAPKKVTISSDGYFEIDGEKSIVKAPLRADGSIPSTSEINDVGIRVVVKDGKYMIGDTYWNNDYRKVSNTGGNSNSIGIETMVNRGSDLYLTWQKTAKLVAHLLVDNNLTLDDVKPHHYFSGKNCPQTMRDNGLWGNFLQLVKAEYEVLTKFADYEITFKSLDSTYLRNNGRIVKQDILDHYVSYEITVSKDGVSKSIVLSSLIPGYASYNLG